MTEAGKARLRLWLRLLKMTRVTEAALRERLRADFGTTLPRFDVMAALSRSDAGLKMSELSGMLRVSNGNVTGIVDRLAEEGHLERVAVPGDRRASRVRLTEGGRAAFAAQSAAHRGWIDELLGGFAEEEAREIAAMMDSAAQAREEAQDAQ